jgi:hypothetical protein
MRKIKFRAWCILGGRGSFIYYDLSERNQFAFEIFDEEEINQQFTGILDKNKKEIYEGDIIEDNGLEKIFEVVFLEGSFCLKDSEGNFYYMEAIRNKIVIGNIFKHGA